MCTPLKEKRDERDARKAAEEAATAAEEAATAAEEAATAAEEAAFRNPVSRRFARPEPVAEEPARLNPVMRAFKEGREASAPGEAPGRSVAQQAPAGRVTTTGSTRRSNSRSSLRLEGGGGLNLPS